MIAKGKSISHLSASIQYALRREEAVILDKNIVSESPREVANEFKLFQALNERCARNSLSFVLSPTIEDGKNLSFEALEKLNKSFLEKMQLQDHQYIAFVHQNTKHKHIHLYVNRIDYTGKAYDDQFISNRSAQIAEVIAQDMGLQTAKSVQKSKQQAKQMDYPQIASIKDLAKSTLAQQKVDSVANFVHSFNYEGAELGLRAEAYHNKQGAFQGLRFYAGEQKFKASEIDRSLSKQHIEHVLQKQIEKLSENNLLPKIEAAESYKINGEVSRPSIASDAIGILGSLMSTGSGVSSASVEEEALDKDKKKKLAKKRRLEMGM